MDRNQQFDCSPYALEELLAVASLQQVTDEVMQDELRDSLDISLSEMDQMVSQLLGQRTAESVAQAVKTGTPVKDLGGAGDKRSSSMEIIRESRPKG